MKKLVIVESPSKAKTISKYLGKNFLVEPTVGHIKDLPKSTFGIDIENEFKPKLVVIRGKNDTVKKIKSSVDKVEAVYIATDPDREGEAIAYDVYEIVEKKKENIHRVLFHEITKKGIEEGMSHPRNIDVSLVDSQRARRIMDRIIGYKISPLLWNHLVEFSSESSLSAGRVQSVTLRIICEREDEINKFIPLEYWSIVGMFKTDKDDEIHAKLISIENKSYKVPDSLASALLPEFSDKYFYIPSLSEADNILEQCKNQKYYISKLDKRNVNRNPEAPFTTSTLQQVASRRYGFRPRQTMQYAQKLYEGIEIGNDGLVGLITYMRTDSTRISDEAVQECRQFIFESYGKEYLPSVPKVYNKKKSNTQDAHEAIRPTSLKYRPQDIKEYLSPELFKLYELIWKRFVACQMNPAVFEQTTVELSGGKFVFKANGTIQLFKGYQVLDDDLPESENGDDDKEDENPKIPNYLELNYPMILEDLLHNNHSTKPPPRFSESTLVKELDNLGIGRPSTFASITATLFDRNYIMQNEKRLYTTELGRRVNELLVSHFDHIFNVNFTAKMESELDEIEEGTNSYINVLNDFYTPFNENFVEVEKHFEKTKCEKCNSDMEIKMGRFGRFLACTNYPDCKNIKSLKAATNQLPEKLNEKCPKCNSDLILRNSKFGQFIGCSSYPNCDYIRPVTIDLKCPKCETGDIIQRRTKKQKIFYGCSGYPNCDYANWDKPSEEKCPNCNKDYLVTKKSGNKTKIHCNSCKYVVNEESSGDE